MAIRNLLGAAVVAGCFGLLMANRAVVGQDQTQVPQTRPRVEVVFCVDTTGSMGGLIDSAKQKIWSICNKIAGGQPTPDLKVGLVAFRDRGDDYITKTFDLSRDLDEIHDHLMSFQAAGGGDEPESVNEALHVALHNVHWNTDPNVLRIIYLVGDAPPHMDYPNDITYEVTCKKAAQRGIIINTIQCGTSQSTTTFWKDIARLALGKFVQIAQDGGVVTVSTPYDKRLVELDAQLAQTSVVYGDARTQAAAQSQIVSQVMVSATPPPAAPGYTFGSSASVAPTASVVTSAADRAGYNAKNSQVGAWDLVDNIKTGKVRLEDVKTEQLPEPMKDLTLAQRRNYLAKVESERSKLQAEVLQLDRQRSDYINQELSRRSVQSGFDTQVLDILREQAKKVKIEY